MKSFIKNAIITNPNSAWTILKSNNILEYTKNLVNFLNKHYKNIPWNQRFWHIKHDVMKIVYCEICNNNPAKWSYSRKKYVCCNKTCIEVLKKKSNMSLFGVNNYAKTKEFKKKAKLTYQKNYGVDHPFKSKIIKDKITKFNIKNFNKKHYQQTKEFKKKAKLTYQKNYGVDNYAKTKEFKENLNKLYEKKFIKNLPCNYEFIEYGKYNENLKLKHKKCGNDFIINKYLYRLRKNRYNIEICTICNPIHKNYSFAEKELLSFIKLIYNNKTIENSRKIIYPYELDIYLPDLKLAIEFNGNYHHANPKKYKADDKIHYKSAKEIWKRDEEKRIRCEKKNINLIVIWEDDWKNKKLITQKSIKNILKTSVV